MLGKITQIKEVGDLNILPDYTSYIGYSLETTKHKYHILIDNYSFCCEEWGYMTSEDDLKDYIGTELKEVRLTDIALNQAKIDEDFPDGFDFGGIQFVDFVTDNGVFQIAVYNAHNGYYGHSILIAQDEEVLMDGEI